MKKWVCTVCGYVYEGENAPEKCPQCGVPASKFKEQEADKMAWACEHEVGVAQGAPEDIMKMCIRDSPGDDQTDLQGCQQQCA